MAIDLENQLLRREENLNNIRLQRLNLQRAEENLALEEKRFEAGTGTNMEGTECRDGFKNHQNSQYTGRISV